MFGIPSPRNPARRPADAWSRATLPWSLASLVLLLPLSFSNLAVAQSDSPLPLRPGDRIEPLAGARQDPTRAFEEAMQSGAEAMQSGNIAAAITAFERAVALQPRQAIAQALLGSALLAAERAEDALEPLGRAIVLDAGLFIAQQNLGLARLQTGRPTEAAEALGAALELEPGNPSVQIMLGRALTLADRPEDAIVYLEAVAEEHPETFLAHRYLGAALLAAGRYQDAVESLTTASRSRPGDLELQTDLALAHLELGERREDAIALLETIVERDPDNAEAWTILGIGLAAQIESPDAQVAAAQALRRALELRPGDLRASLELSSIYYLFRLHDDAIAVLDDVAAGPSEQVPLELERFRHLQRSNEYERAARAAERAIEAGAGPEAYYYLGFALTYLREFDGAIEAYRMAVEKDPGMAIAHRELGSLLIDRQLYEEAQAELEQAIAADAADVEAHYLLGLALFRGGDPGSAIPSLERAVELDPEHASAHYNLGTVLRMTGRSEEGMAEMQRFQELQAQQRPGAARMDQYLANLVQQGIFLAKIGQGQRAVDLFNRALENEPSSDLVLFNLGLVLYDLNRLEEAAAALEQAIEVNPARAEAYAALANTYRAQGRDDDARRMRARYEELRRQQQAPTA